MGNQSKYNPLKWQVNPEETPQLKLHQLKQEETREESRPSPSISTESSSKFTQKLVSQEINEHHELIHQRHLREDRRRVLKTRHLQQETHSLLQRGPNRRQTPPPRRARQARRFRGN